MTHTTETVRKGQAADTARHAARKPADDNISILVVDDEPDIRAATARLLRNAGYPVIEAENGEGCFGEIYQHHPDLVLLDVVLPDIDGYEVCRKIRSDEALKNSYILLLSGQKTGSDDQSEGLEIGADGYVARPVSNRELLARVAAMERIIRAERERDYLIAELRAAVANIKTLHGLLPICCHCKQIRDDQGYWSQVEVYIQARTHADFSHSICPDCVEKLYPDDE